MKEIDTNKAQLQALGKAWEDLKTRHDCDNGWIHVFNKTITSRPCMMCNPSGDKNPSLRKVYNIEKGRYEYVNTSDSFNTN